MYRHLVAVFFGVQASVQAQPLEIHSLEAVRVGAETVFVVEIDRPADMDDISTNRWAKARDPWPRFPRLETEDPREALSAMEMDQFDTWKTRRNSGPLVFVGKTNSADTLSMTLYYPAVENDTPIWREAPFSLALNEAEDLSSDPPPLHRWARAQAGWFDLLNDHIDEPFFSFAAQQTLRRMGVEEKDGPPRARRRSARSPDDQLYDLISGSLAIQESLQLDRMIEPIGDRGARSVALSEIQ